MTYVFMMVHRLNYINILKKTEASSFFSPCFCLSCCRPEKTKTRTLTDADVDGRLWWKLIQMIKVSLFNSLPFKQISYLRLSCHVWFCFMWKKISCAYVLARVYVHALFPGPVWVLDYPTDSRLNQTNHLLTSPRFFTPCFISYCFVLGVRLKLGWN